MIYERLAIDLINGSTLLRDWVDAPGSSPDELDAIASHDESTWREKTAEVMLYR
jgi:hypothetical protein